MKPFKQLALNIDSFSITTIHGLRSIDPFSRSTWSVNLVRQRHFADRRAAHSAWTVWGSV